MRQLVGTTSIDFMALRRLGYLISALLVAGGLAAMTVRHFGQGAILNFGIDFTGGTVVEIKFADTPPIPEIRKRLAEAGLAGAAIQSFGDEDAHEILVRVKEQTEEQRNIDKLIRSAMWSPEELEKLDAGQVDLNNVGRGEMAAALAAASGRPGDPEAEASFRGFSEAVVDYRVKHGGLVQSLEELDGIPGYTGRVKELVEQALFPGGFTTLRVESVGPAVGDELKSKAVWAIVLAIAGILIYISLRFEFRFGLAAVVCLAHDVIVTVGAFALTGREVDLPVVAALLTIVGYSLNDTIVVFDRVRDNLKIRRREELPKIVNRSVNEMLSRTLLTSLTTLLVVSSLFVLGGPVINGFAFALMIGVLVGTYSSVFVASAFLVEWTRLRHRGAR